MLHVVEFVRAVADRKALVGDVALGDLVRGASAHARVSGSDDGRLIPHRLGTPPEPGRERLDVVKREDREVVARVRIDDSRSRKRLSVLVKELGTVGEVHHVAICNHEPAMTSPFGVANDDESRPEATSGSRLEKRGLIGITFGEASWSGVRSPALCDGVSGGSFALRVDLAPGRWTALLVTRSGGLACA